MICHLVRLVVELRYDSGTNPPAWLRRHLESCSACRGDLAALAAMEHTLRGTAGSARREPGPFLAARVTQAVQCAGTPPPARQGRFPRFALVLAGTFALGLAIVGGRLAWRPSPAVSAPTPWTLEGTRMREALAVTDPASLLAASQRLDDPLQRELDLIVADARSAAQSLAVAFLPVDGP